MNKESKRKELLRLHKEVGICPNCQDFMIWKEESYTFSFQNKKITIKNIPVLICLNTFCSSTGKNHAELEYIKGRAKRRFFLTGEVISDYNFLKKYTD